MKRPEGCIGPASESALIYKSPLFVMPTIREASIEEAGKWVSTGWNVVSTFQKEWNAILKNLSSEIYKPLKSRGVIFGSLGKSESRGMYYSYYPILLNEPDGQWWGMLADCSWISDEDQLHWSLRDLLTAKHSSSITSILTSEGGHMLWQNASSLELFGCHSQTVGSSLDAEGNNSPFNLLDLFFGSNDDSESLQSQMRSVTAEGGTFHCNLEVSNPALRSLCQLIEGQEMHLDCQVTETQDPKSLKKIFIVCQSDVTELLVNRKVLEVERNLRKSLEIERAKLDRMMQKQMDLIEILRWVGEVGRRAGTRARASQLIDKVKRQLSRASEVVTEEEEEINLTSSFDDLNVISLLGEGGFGRVYKGKWRDLTVAVKRMILPSELTRRDKRQMMALMELAITSALLHTNIVKTHSYSIRPIRESLKQALSTGPSKSLVKSSPSSFEIQIIMEHCDLGTLRGAYKILSTGQSLITTRPV